MFYLFFPVKSAAKIWPYTQEIHCVIWKVKSTVTAQFQDCFQKYKNTDT